MNLIQEVIIEPGSNYSDQSTFFFSVKRHFSLLPQKVIGHFGAEEKKKTGFKVRIVRFLSVSGSGNQNEEKEENGNTKKR